MPTWSWIVVAVAVAMAAGLVTWRALAARRSGQLQEQFGPEYDRAVGSADSKRDAEAELEARAERRQEFDIRPLPPVARDRYLRNWQVAQAQFVDAPRTAVASADSLIQSVMAERGYPVEDFEQRASDISVDHPDVVENYRQGHRLAVEGSGDTESLRLAMRHFRSLFDELLGDDADAPLERGAADDRRIEESRLLERRPRG